MDNLFIKENVRDIEIMDVLNYLSCILNIINLKQIISLIIHIDIISLHFLVFYMSILNKQYKYKCRFNQHTLMVFDHFKDS